MNSSSRRNAILAFIFANIIWGSGLPIYKWSLQNIHPITFAFLRFFLASIVLFPFVYKHFTIEKSDRKRLVIQALIGISIAIPLLFLGLQQTTSITAPIILSSGPIILIIGSMFFLREKLKEKVVFGTLISLCGILYIIFQPLLGAKIPINFWGNILIFMALLASIAHTLLIKKLTMKYKPLVIAFWTFTIGCIGMLPFFIVEVSHYGFLSHIDARGFIGLGYAAILSSVIAVSLALYGQSKIPTSEVGIFTYIDPVATAIVALPLLGEQITPSLMIGAGLLFIGIFIAEGRIHYHPFHLLKK